MTQRRNSIRDTFIGTFVVGGLVVGVVLLGGGCGGAAANRPSTGSGAAISESDFPPPDAPATIDPIEQAVASSAANPLPPVRPGAPTKALAAAGDRPFDKTFDDIKFDIEVGVPFKRSMLPASIESMVGERIRIRGYILPTAQKRGIKQFVLVRDNQECCFGPGAALYDCIFVEMEPDKSAEFSVRPVAVMGIFGVNEILGPDGKHLAIYHLRAEEVRL